MWTRAGAFTLHGRDKHKRLRWDGRARKEWGSNPRPPRAQSADHALPGEPAQVSWAESALALALYFSLHLELASPPPLGLERGGQGHHRTLLWASLRGCLLAAPRWSGTLHLRRRSLVREEPKEPVSSVF